MRALPPYHEGISVQHAVVHTIELYSGCHDCQHTLLRKRMMVDETGCLVGSYASPFKMH